MLRTRLWMGAILILLTVGVLPPHAPLDQNAAWQEINKRLGVDFKFDVVPNIRRANVVIVVAGMEGALPSVVTGLLSKPVIAVPTSIGYGASFGGLAALLGMLNSCATGMTVVNIDNGFGAGYAASLINSLAAGEQ